MRVVIFFGLFNKIIIFSIHIQSITYEIHCHTVTCGLSCLCVGRCPKLPGAGKYTCATKRNTNRKTTRGCGKTGIAPKQQRFVYVEHRHEVRFFGNA